MGTVSKKLADEIIAGKYPEDGWLRIIKYENLWGGFGYGLENKDNLGTYIESPFVRNPQIYWEAKND